MPRRPSRSSSASHPQDINYLARDHNLPRCWVVGNTKHRLMPNNVSSVITKIFKEDIHIDGVNWKAVPENYKKKYFEKFKDHFSWAPSNGHAVCTAFMNQASIRYKDMMSTFKRASQKKPDCVTNATWENWLEFWSRPEVMAKSEKARQNRKTEKAGPGTGCSRHTGGSRSAYAHALALEMEMGRAPDAYACMLRMHTRKDGTILDKQARVIAATVEDRARAARAAAGNDDIDMTELYCQVVPVVKQRLFGTGSKALDFVDSGPTARSAPVNEEMTRQRVSQEQHQQSAEQIAEQDAHGQERSQTQEMEQKLRVMQVGIIGEMRRQGLIPPRGPDA